MTSAGSSQTTDTPHTDVTSWKDCAHRADFASAAEHERDCPEHGEDR